MVQRATNCYDDLFVRLIGDRVSQRIAVERVGTAYLDGKPLPVGKRKLTKKERDSLFWSSDVVKGCPPDAWGAEAMSLALARYLGQEPVTADRLVTRVAREAPEVLIRAVRHSGLVLNPHSPRRAELDEAASECEAVAELCRVLDVFTGAHRERVAALEAQKAQLAALSVFELLLYASLYAFEGLVPRDFNVKAPAPSSGANVQVAWDALGDLLAWKLAEAGTSSLKLTDDNIGRSLARHLRPILFESGTASAGEALRNLRAFHALMDMQIELNEFISRSSDAFSYDDGIRFERRGNRLEIVEVDPAARAAWQRDGLKLERLHGYWFHRALDTYVEQVAADPATWKIGRPENAEANRLAWLRALQTQLRLREAYGVADEVTSDSGDTVDLFRALLSLNLMSVFFQQDFLAAFAERYDASGDRVAALQRLTMDGLREGLQNRMPLTWSSRDSKVSNIIGWTVTASEPAGNPRMASAILDFWTYDTVATAERLQRKEPGLQPDLFERPVFKFGATLYWLGVKPSYSRPRVSDDNAYAEALIRTAKYRPEFPVRGFADLAQARQWTAAFVRWYNVDHWHSGIRYVSPAQRHAGEDHAILAARHAVYLQARTRNPARWSRHTRNWTPIGAVTLNPEKDSVVGILSKSTNQTALAA